MGRAPARLAIAPSRRPIAERPAPRLGRLPGVVRTHLDALTGAFGIYQHARGSRPDPGLGYCTDDVARAAIVDVLHGHEIGRAAVAESLQLSLRFLAGAVVEKTGRLRNFRDNDGNWLEREGSADAHARGVQALGVISGDLGDDRLGRVSAAVLEDVLPVSLQLEGLRPWAHVILGCVAAGAGKRTPGSARIVLEELAGRLLGAFESTEPDWPWPEPRVTYENAILAQALIEGGQQLGYPGMVERGLAILGWLLDQQVTDAGYLELIGNQGWWPRGSQPARFDQQPIDAASIVECCAAAWRVSGQAAWRNEMERAYAWFLGANTVGIPVSDPERGSCADGLNVTGVNGNQGAESTLAWLTATECVRANRGTARLA